MLSVLVASLGLSHRFHLKPQATFSTEDKLGEATHFPGGGPESGVLSWQQTKPEQSQGHDHAQLSQGKLLPDAVPVSAGRIPSDFSYVKGSAIVRGQYLGPEEKGMKAWEDRPSWFVGSNRRGSKS